MLARLAVLFAAFLFACAPALAAEKRLALVLSNQDYPASVGRLANTHADGDTVAAALKDSGFVVTRGKDLDSAGMDDVLTDFEKAINASAAKGDQVVVFFYASMHGAATEVDGRTRNFLLPAKEEITTPGQLIRKGVRLDLVIQTLGSTDAKAVVIVSDACRNTLAASFRKGGDKGFVMERAGPGMLIAYATEAGSTAPDDGLFARLLAGEIREKGVKASYALLDTLGAVGRQRSWDGQPFMTGGLPDWFCFAGCEEKVAVTSPDGFAKWTSLSAYPRGDIKTLPLEIRRVVETARGNAEKAEAAAGRARSAAAIAEDIKAKTLRGEKGYSSPGNGVFRWYVMDGRGDDFYAVQELLETDRIGEKYSGHFWGLQYDGPGVLTYAPSSPLARYEGEWTTEHAYGATSKASGIGIFYLRDGSRWAGYDQPGVQDYPDGRRYEGELKGARPNGLGVLWDARGKGRAGLWVDGTLQPDHSSQNTP